MLLSNGLKEEALPRQNHAANHDHGDAGCEHVARAVDPASVEAGLSRAEALCLRQDTRLTPLRRSVLELVLESVAPVGAYTVLERLQEKLDRRVAPPTVYRALDFLLRQGLIHRIERFNAFVACPHPGEGHRAQFLICTCCGLVRELDDAPVDEAIDRAAKRAGFAIERGLVEIEGRCPECCATR